MGNKSAVKADIIIGIDPDVNQSGVGRLDVAELKATATHLPFPLLVDYVKDVRDLARRQGKTLVVFVESSWHETHNWHLSWKDSKAVASNKGYAVGSMHETGKKIVEMLDYHGVDVREQRPLVKCWQGKDRKITHEEMTAICRWGKKRSNQEERDAMLIAWNASGLPIRIIKPKK